MARFSFLNVRVGGPYRVNVMIPGFRPATIEDLNVALGETSEVPVTLQLETLTETVEVRLTRRPRRSPRRKPFGRGDQHLAPRS